MAAGHIVVEVGHTAVDHTAGSSALRTAEHQRGLADHIAVAEGTASHSLALGGLVLGTVAALRSLDSDGCFVVYYFQHSGSQIEDRVMKWRGTKLENLRL